MEFSRKPTSMGCGSPAITSDASEAALKKASLFFCQRLPRITVLELRGVGFRSLTESMDTTTSGGRLIFLVSGALAEF